MNLRESGDITLISPFYIILRLSGFLSSLLRNNSNIIVEGVSLRRSMRISLRYFILGSIFIIHATALVFPLLNTLVFFVQYPDAVIAVVGGVFAAGPAFGYLI